MNRTAFFRSVLVLPLLSVFFLLTPASSAFAASTWYVDINASGAQTGLDHVDAFHSIQAAINAASAGDTIDVYPGNYNETAPNSTLTFADGGGTYQFGLFLPANKSGLTLVGVDTGGNPITNANNILAHVTTNSTANFGPDGVFVEGANDTIQALDIGANIGGANKTIEDVADNFTLKYSEISEPTGGDLYIDAFNGALNTVNKYTVVGNLFALGATLDIANGAGASTPATDRQVTGNTFSGASANYPYALISFDGTGGKSWYANPVGGAVITGNTFSSGGNGTEYIRQRGTVSDQNQFDWASYWNNNTFDAKVMVTTNGNPSNPEVYSYTDSSGPYNFINVRDIGTSIQNEMANAQNGDTELVGTGTYMGDVMLPAIPNFTLVGQGTPVINLGSDYGINLDNPPAVVTGFTMSGFTINASPSTTYALKAYKADGLTLANDTFNGGAGNTGGGVDINTTSNVTFNNVISSGFYKNGFADTSAYTSADSSASGNNITFNNITATHNGWTGISFYTVGNSGGSASINGVHFTGTNTISGNGAGIFLEGDTDAHYGTFATPVHSITSDGMMLDLTPVAFSGNIADDIINYQTAPVNAIGATFGGLTGDSMTQPQIATENSLIVDKLDHSNLGLVSYYTPDTTPPVVTVTPVAGSLLHGTETFTITVTDNKPLDPTKNKSIYVYLYNSGGTQKHQGANVDLSSGTGTFSVDTTQLDDGDTWLDVGQLQDAAGNKTPGDTYFAHYIVDNTAPTVSVTPVAGSALSGTEVFNITINDAHPATSTNSAIYVYLYNVTDQTQKFGEKVDLSSDTGTFTVDTTLLPNGTYDLDVGELHDAAGNATVDQYHPNGIDSYFTNYTINNTAPDITPPSTPTLIAPANGVATTTNDFYFTWNPSADDSNGPITYQFHSSMDPTEAGGVLTNSLWTSGTLNDPSIHSTGAPDGTWYWQVRAQDANGTWSAWSPIWSVTLSTKPVTTNSATSPDASDEVLNGTVGAANVDNTSFWWGTTNITTPLVAGIDPGDSIEFPSTDWHHDNGLGHQNGGANFSEPLGNLTPGTTYYVVAWVQLNGIWYPGQVVNFSTNGDTPSPSVTTGSATAIDATDETVNAQNGPAAADNTSFWWGTTNITTPLVAGTDPGSSEFPGVANGWQHDNGLGQYAANGSFSENLSGLSNGTYYYVAWIKSNGTWYPGSIEQFTVGNTPVTPDVPTLESPANGSMVNSSDFNFSWDTFATTTPVTYEWESSLSNTTGADGSFQSQLADHSGLTDTTLDSPATPDNTYYWHVRATDGVGNVSPWSDTWAVKVNTSGGGDGTPTSKTDQTISINPINGATTLETSTTTVASVDSGLPLTYSAADDQPCSIADANDPTITISGAGSCTITVAQAGDSTHNSAAKDLVFTIEDKTPPVVSAHDDVTATTLTNSAVVDFTAPSAVDAKDGTVSPVCTPNSGSTFPVGTTPVTCTATDAAGNVGSTTFNVIVTQTTPAPQVTQSLSVGGGGVVGSSPLSFGYQTGGVVLGTSTEVTSTDTTLPAGCSALLTQYMGFGKKNDSSQVKLLQVFLNGNLNTNLPVTGFFGSMTTAAVKQFQTKYASVILTPWGLKDPTGYVYKFTEYEINLLSCSTLNAPVPTAN